MQRLIAAILFCLLTPGCLILEVGATNPIPGLSKVAIVPFFNLSQEPAKVVDGRRFAMAYYAELQKTPGFDVLPIGVAEQAIVENQLQMNDPEDVLELARILNVDAVVVGAITDYDPYYPPRIGLKISWYSPQQWEFYPGIQTDMEARPRWNERAKADKAEAKMRVREARANAKASSKTEKLQLRNGFKVSERDTVIFRGQTNEVEVVTTETGDQSRFSLEKLLSKPKRIIPSFFQSQSTQNAESLKTPQVDTPPIPSLPNSPPAKSQRTMSNDPLVLPPKMQMSPSEMPLPPAAVSMQFDVHQPLMSYTRIFDGADANLVATLRDYVELSGDRRSGGWEAYLHRSDDFIRFTAHLMIVEMLSLHGGEARRRWVIKWRKHR